jgi:hypothetical protein
MRRASDSALVFLESFTKRYDKITNTHVTYTLGVSAWPKDDKIDHLEARTLFENTILYSYNIV